MPLRALVVGAAVAALASTSFAQPAAWYFTVMAGLVPAIHA